MNRLVDEAVLLKPKKHLMRQAAADTRSSELDTTDWSQSDPSPCVDLGTSSEIDRRKIENYADGEPVRSPTVQSAHAATKQKLTSEVQSKKSHSYSQKTQSRESVAQHYHPDYNLDDGAGQSVQKELQRSIRSKEADPAQGPTKIPFRETVSPAHSRVASTLPEQLAACRSLAKIGLANVKLEKIERYSNATIRWVQSLESFLTNEDTRQIYRHGVPRIHHIHKLAIFHNKPIRPPKRFVCAARGKHVKRRVPIVYRDALSEYRRIAEALTEFHEWIDVEALPINEQALKLLDCILDDSSLNRLSPARRKAMLWYEQLLQPSYSLSIQLANGNLEKLRSALDTAFRYSNHVHFKRSLGQEFSGIDTPWQSLHATIEFSQSLHDVIGDPSSSAQLVDQWSTQGSLFYSLARQASSLSRRLYKLDKLTRRHERLLHPSNSDDRLISTIPEQYLLQAQKAVVRLKLWVDVAVAGRNNGHLTPADVLHSLKP